MLNYVAYSQYVASYRRIANDQNLTHKKIYDQSIFFAKIVVTIESQCTVCNLETKFHTYKNINYLIINLGKLLTISVHKCKKFDAPKW